MKHYHKRSNVESVFAAVKAKFGSRLRCKLPTAQANEALLKILCHNICCLYSQCMSLGLRRTFWQRTKSSHSSLDAGEDLNRLLIRSCLLDSTSISFRERARLSCIKVSIIFPAGMTIDMPAFITRKSLLQSHHIDHAIVPEPWEVDDEP